MCEKRIKTLCYILLLNIVLAVVTFDIEYEITYKHKCLVSELFIRYFVKISLRQCVRECAVRPVCLSINYKRRQLLCELYSVEDGTFIENNSRNGPCVFVRKTSFDPQTPSTCSCGSAGVCDTESNTCPVMECPKLTLNKGMLIGNLHALGSIRKIKCDENHMEAESMEYTTCQQDTGVWSYIPRCITDSCSTTPVTEFSQKYTNVALHKPVSLSTEHHPGSLMVDGDLSQFDTDCAHTLRDTIGIIHLDLQQSYTMYALHIYNRQDCCADRLTNVSILIGDTKEDLRLHVYHKDPIGSTCTFVLVQPCRGRFIKITNDPANPLTICEFQVYGE